MPAEQHAIYYEQSYKTIDAAHWVGVEVGVVVAGPHATNTAHNTTLNTTQYTCSIYIIT